MDIVTSSIGLDLKLSYFGHTTINKNIGTFSNRKVLFSVFE